MEKAPGRMTRPGESWRGEEKILEQGPGPSGLQARSLNARAEPALRHRTDLSVFL